MKVSSLFYFVILIQLISSCGSIYNTRSFSSIMDKQNDNDELFAPGRDFPIVAGDSQKVSKDIKYLNSRVPRNSREKESSLELRALKYELQNLENGLDDIDYQNYINIKQKLGNMSYKIHYLHLSKNDQKHYIQNLNILNYKNRNKNRR